jgi:hypothetical protein
MTELIIVVAVVVVVLALGAVAVLQAQSWSLKRRFGPEYDRMVEQEGDRRRAEAGLRDRAKRHDALTIQALDPDATSRYKRRWQEVQLSFVDDPRTSLSGAGSLVEEVMRHRGYPVDGTDERFAMLSVDYPSLTHGYRAAHAVEHQRGQSATTADLRQAFIHYRALFDELVADRSEEDERDDADQRQSQTHVLGGGQR